jgi:hypothetical protein
VYLKQRVRTKLEKVAAILKSEITHDAFEFVQIIKADAGRALSSKTRCFVFRRRFHNDFHTQGVRSLIAAPRVDTARAVTTEVLAGLDDRSGSGLQSHKVIALTWRAGILALDGPRRHFNRDGEIRNAGGGMAL